MTDIVERLWQSDEASALTNEAAREIERLRKEVERLQSSLSAISGAMAHDPNYGLCFGRSQIGFDPAGMLNEQKDR